MQLRDSFTVGWICALQEEYEAACRMVDEELQGPEYAEPNDSNTYFFGRIGEHRVVIGCLAAGRYGLASATCVSQDMIRSFPQIRFGLMVGIGGGAPTPERDIRLGDVVVSVPNGKLSGVVQFDLGKRVNGRFERVGHMNAPPAQLLSVLPEMRRRHGNPDQYGGVDEHLKRFDDDDRFHRPELDRLFRIDSPHGGAKRDCTECDAEGLVMREPRTSRRAIEIFYGTIASSNTVMKNPEMRDSYANDPELNVLCFEMEAAGMMDSFPCLVIRGVCDYCDGHKNDDWHFYAAATAAAYARELLCVVKSGAFAQL
ncbi:purine and uridine phosphorylase [Trichoderma sp. SZMC 28014]